MIKKNSKTHRKHHAAHRHHVTRHPKMKGRSMPSTTSSNWDETVRAKDTLQREPEGSPEAAEQGEFTPGELGQPGPLDQGGEGNRQNDELDELEHIEPEKESKRS